MPVERDKTPSPRKSRATSNNDTSSPSKAWSQADKSLLFEHVRVHGETTWDKAVPGKTAQQSREQWKRILLPMIRKQCNFLG
ncbi:uncharacterized protein IL334_001629 [Kwoniella shivajii]|uniref:Myb-like domain-containing protein n=1 Tax=Kwoniella shivajii TaxID=564305 RepID=A0ABZ1CST7_9TREE|nr:hypothetical protein IL334_001629 [Kwoniella shivajii]